MEGPSVVCTLSCRSGEARLRFVSASHMESVLWALGHVLGHSAGIVRGLHANALSERFMPLTIPTVSDSKRQSESVCRRTPVPPTLQPVVPSQMTH
jgi:TctA family transporter